MLKSAILLHIMLRHYTKHSPGEEFRQVHTPHTEGVWTHAERPTDEELEIVEKSHNLDPNIVNDLRDNEELPRVEYSGDTLYVFLRSAQRSKHGEVITAPLLAAATTDAFITLTSTNSVAESKIVNALHQDARSEDKGALLLSTFTAVIVDYQVLINRTGKYIKDIGHRLRTHEVNNSDFVHFVTIEDNLNEYTLNLTGMRAVAERLRENKHDTFSAKDCEALDDLVLFISQLISIVSSHGQSVTSIRNAYSTIANNNLNRRMKTLTVLTVLITLPNVFFGMYGMNVSLPFENEAWAYSAIVLFTLGLILSVYLLAKRFKVF